MIGEESLSALVDEYVTQGKHFAAAKALFGLVFLQAGNREKGCSLLKEALDNLDRSARTNVNDATGSGQGGPGSLTLEGLVLQWEILSKYTWFLSNGWVHCSSLYLPLLSVMSCTCWLFSPTALIPRKIKLRWCGSVR